MIRTFAFDTRHTAEACKVTFEPGPWNGSVGGTTAEAVTPWVLEPGMLPDGVDQPWNVGSTAFVQLVN